MMTTHLARLPGSGKPKPVALPQIFLAGALPAHLDDLGPDLRRLVGRAIDSGAARLLLDTNGRAIVAAARRP
jgi:hypothetical protein